MGEREREGRVTSKDTMTQTFKICSNDPRDDVHNDAVQHDNDDDDRKPIRTAQLIATMPMA